MRHSLMTLLVCACVATTAIPGSTGLAGSTAIVKSGRAFVPLRAVFEWLGAEVDYSGGRITATRASDTITLRIGSRSVAVNGRTERLDHEPFVAEGRSYVPLRFVAQSLGAGVEYDAASQTITIRDAGRVVSLRVGGEREWVEYPDGGWFVVKYPGDFRVVPREECIGRLRGDGEPPYRDGVSFISPDGLVEFYVYSPLHKGDSNWVALRPGETIGDTTQAREGDRALTYVNIQGPDNKYHRAYVRIVEDYSMAEWYFGIKYPDQATYETYRPAYLKFKASLVQYAD